MTKHVRKLGNTLLPLNFLLELNGDPVNLASYTVKIRIEEEGGTAIVNDSATGVTAHPTQTFTATSAGLALCNGHGLDPQGGQQVIVSSSGTLPAGLAAATRYFAVNVTPNAFGLAATPDGVSVITGAGSGTHSFYIVGSLQYDFQSGDVDAAGFFNSWVIIESGGEQHHFPASGQHKIEIQAVGN